MGIPLIPSHWCQFENITKVNILNNKWLNGNWVYSTLNEIDNRHDTQIDTAYKADENGYPSYSKPLTAVWKHHKSKWWVIERKLSLSVFHEIDNCYNNQIDTAHKADENGFSFYSKPLMAIWKHHKLLSLLNIK